MIVSNNKTVKKQSKLQADVAEKTLFRKMIIDSKQANVSRELIMEFSEMAAGKCKSYPLYPVAFSPKYILFLETTMK